MRFEAFEKYGIPYRVKDPQLVIKLEDDLRNTASKFQGKNLQFSTDYVIRFRKLWTGDNPVELERQKNLKLFYDWIEAHFPLRLNHLKKMQTQLSGCPANWRTTRIFSKELSNEVKAEFPPPEAVPQLMQELELWNESRGTSIAELFSLHLMIESIHPFEDGNGRIARAFVYSGLKEEGIQPFDRWHPELIVHWAHDEYVSALRLSCSTGYLDPFLTTMFGLYLNSAKPLT